MALKLQAFINNDLRKKILTNVKYEGINLNAMTTTLKSMVNCVGLELEAFQGTYFGDATLKACQYETFNDKTFIELHEISIKSTQNYF